jgi:hypothetical protein
MLSQYEEYRLRLLVQDRSPMVPVNAHPSVRTGEQPIDGTVDDLINKALAQGPLRRVAGPTNEQVIDHNYRMGGLVPARPPVAITE